MKAIFKFCAMTFGLSLPLTAMFAFANRHIPGLLIWTTPSNMSSSNPMTWTITGSAAYWVNVFGFFILMSSAGFLAWLLTEIIEAKAEELGLK